MFFFFFFIQYRYKQESLEQSTILWFSPQPLRDFSLHASITENVLTCEIAFATIVRKLSRKIVPNAVLKQFRIFAL